MPFRHGSILAFLTLLFSFRVLGQVLVAFLGVSWLPIMEQWYSGLIPYPILLTIQLVMLVFMAKISMDILHGVGFFAVRRSNLSLLLISFAAIYAGAMLLRYVLTMIFRPEMRWSGGTIPIFFHFVLAAFVFVLGHYHSEIGKQ
jgi:hypothetical protein